jgi:hypothetical protein
MKRGSQVLYLGNPNGEAEVLQYYYGRKCQKIKIDIDFASLSIKGRVSKGIWLPNIQSKK